MTEEELKAIIQKEMDKAITQKIDSALIFKYINNLEKEIEKKDKMIDEMAGELTTPMHNKEWIKKYFSMGLEENK